MQIPFHYPVLGHPRWISLLMLHSRISALYDNKQISLSTSLQMNLVRLCEVDIGGECSG